MSIHQTFAKNIVDTRKQKKITQEKLALDISLSVSHLRAIEHASGNPTLETMSKIAVGLDVDLFVLLTPGD